MARTQHGVELHGWTAGWRTTAKERREVTLTKDGHKPVIGQGRTTTPEEIILQSAMQSALMEEVRLAPQDDQGYWMERLNALSTDIRVGKASRAIEAAIRQGQEV